MAVKYRHLSDGTDRMHTPSKHKQQKATESGQAALELAMCLTWQYLTHPPPCPGKPWNQPPAFTPAGLPMPHRVPGELLHYPISSWHVPKTEAGSHRGLLHWTAQPLRHLLRLVAPVSRHYYSYPWEISQALPVRQNATKVQQSKKESQY